MRRRSAATADDYFERYTSQIAAIGRQGQEKLRKTRVHIAGFGGIGNLLALFLSTLGVGYISANDPQRLALENLGSFICGEESDIGKYKVDAAARFLHRNRHLSFQPVVAPNESAMVDELYATTDWIFCCANTHAARIAATQKALLFMKPIIDVGVADGRTSLSGIARYWLPECADWSACPACYLASNPKISKNEGLLFSVLTTTAMLAIHVMMSLVTGVDAHSMKLNNCLMVELGQLQIERLAVIKRKRCVTCAKIAGHTETERQKPHHDRRVTAPKV